MPVGKLAEAIALVKSGKSTEARPLLLLILKDDPHNESAWLWLAQSFPDEPSRIKVLQRCLQFNPDSQTARQGLEGMWARQAGLEAPIRAAPGPAPGSAPLETPPQAELPKVPAFLEGPYNLPAETPAEPAPAAPTAPPAASAAPPADPGTPPPAQAPPPGPAARARSRLTTLDFVMIAIILAIVAATAGYLLWNRYLSNAPSPEAQATRAALTAAIDFLSNQSNRTAAPTLTASPSLVVTPRLTNTPLISPTPTFDPNSPVLLYGGDQACEVNAVNLGGGQSVPLTLDIPDNCIRVRISPDGEKVLYSIQEGDPDDLTGSVEVASLQEASSVRILDRVKYLYLADWAPDSQWISYLTVAGLNQAGPILGLNLIRADGSSHFQLTNERAGTIKPVGEPLVWSPDGRWLAFVADGSLQLIRSDGSGLTKLVDDFESVAFETVAMAWAPDNFQIAYYLKDGAGIQLVNQEGEQQPVRNPEFTSPDDGQSLAWTADGRQLVAFNAKDNTVVSVSADGLALLSPLFEPGGFVRQVSLSPDGKYLAFIEVSESTDALGSLKVYDFESGDVTALEDRVAADVPLVWDLPAGQPAATPPIPITPPTPTITRLPTQAGALGNGLLLYYNFNEDPSGSVRDWSGNGRHGTLQGGDYQPVYGPQKALAFSDTSIETTDPFNGDEAGKLTLSFFYQPARGNITYSGVLCSWTNGALSGPTVDLYYHEENPDDPTVYIEGTGADLVGTDADGQIRHHYIVTAKLQDLWDVSAPRWYHLAITYDKASGIAQIYVDGRLDTTRNLGKFTPLTSGYNLVIGQNPAGTSPKLEGSLDEIRIYNRVLTAAEILKLAQFKVP